MIDETIKHVIRKLNLDEFRGKLYSPYIKLQINTKIKKIMEGMKDIVFKQYTIESIQFVKTAPAVGYISIKVSIVPYGTLERINIVMGV
jgi:aminopeptidase C